MDRRRVEPTIFEEIAHPHFGPAGAVSRHQMAADEKRGDIDEHAAIAQHWQHVPRGARRIWQVFPDIIGDNHVELPVQHVLADVVLRPVHLAIAGPSALAPLPAGGDFQRIEPLGAERIEALFDRATAR